MLYLSEQTARRSCGGLPPAPQAVMAGQPLYSARALKPVLAGGYRAGRVTQARYQFLMDWFERVL